MPEASAWEYRVQTFGSAWRGPKDEELEESLNAWGEEGWEVTAMTSRQGNNKVTVVARRPLTESVRRRRTLPGME
jgi:hypothetical protein